SYEEDNEIKEIYDILKENLPIPKSIHNHIKHYSIEDNLLYFSVVKGGNDRRIVVSPKSTLAQEIIGNAHDARSRLTEIIGIAGIDETNDTLDVYWKDCDPCHSSSIPFSLFLEIPEDLQKTLWDNAKAIDKDNKLRDEVSKAAG
ncbi:Transposon Ty3-G Gag-Pol polyprotein, partial [Pichia kudriavzevii]